MKTYEGRLTYLEPHQVFVFGSNTEGRHGAGSAFDAVQHFGAVRGNAYGPMGQAYGIVTKDLTKFKHPSISVVTITHQIFNLYRYAKDHPELEFFVAYSGTGKNLNGYTPQQMAEMFGLHAIPDNIVFEKDFAALVQAYGHRK